MLTVPNNVPLNSANAPYNKKIQHDNSNVVTMTDYTNLYIKNLDQRVTSLDLFNRFRVFGKIISARVMKDTATGISKGYGFVSFSQIEEAQEALQHMNGALFNTKNIVVTFHVHKKVSKRESGGSSGSGGDGGSPGVAVRMSPGLSSSPSMVPYNTNTFMSEPNIISNKAYLNPWNENAGIWMHNNHNNNKNSTTISATAAAAAAATTAALYHATTNNNYLVSPQLTSNTSYNNLQYQKLREAISFHLDDYQQKDLDDLVDLIQSLKKKDLSICLFNPTFLKQKIDEAYEALYLFQNNNSNSGALLLQQKQQQKASVSTTTTPSLIIAHGNDQDYHSSASAILSSLEGMSMNKKKRIFGDIFFPHVRATGIKHAPKVTIRLLDTVPLEELAFNMYDKQELTRKAQQIHSELYCCK